MLAVTDFLSNIFIFKDGQLYKTLLNAHAKLITDIQWLFTFNESVFGDYHNNDAPTPYLSSCSMDGSLKLWDLDCPFVPLYEYLSSKKWVYHLHWDPSVSALIFNSEGKYFP